MIKRTTKNICFILFLCVACLLLFGCSGTDNDSASTNTETFSLNNSNEQHFDDNWINDNTYKYNNDISKFCAMCSSKIEEGNHGSYDSIRNYLKESGFYYSKDGAHDESTDSGVCLISHKVIHDNGKDTVVLLICCRGSQTLQEFIGDAISQAWHQNQPFIDNSQIYNNVYEFQKSVFDNLYWYGKETTIDNDGTKLQDIDENHLKVFITGHSLGGAAANAVSAKINYESSKHGWWLNRLSKSDIYTYTYGAIKVLGDKYNDSTNIDKNYENIHNIYNYYDSFGPNGSQSNWAASVPNKKFGHTEIFKNQKDDSDNTNCHNMPAYIEAIENINDSKYDFRFSCSKDDDDDDDDDPVSTSWLIGKWTTSDGWKFTFKDDNTFTLDMGLGYEESGTYALSSPLNNSYPITLNGTSLLSLMKMIYGAADSNYHFEILKTNDSKISLVQVYSNYTAETSPCKLSLSKI